MFLPLAMASSLLIGGYSYHATSDKYDFNSNHQVIGIEHNGYGFGHYKNSYYKNSFFGYKFFDVYGNFGFKVGVMGGYQGRNKITEIAHTGYVVDVMATYRTKYADYAVSPLEHGVLFTVSGKINLLQ